MTALAGKKSQNLNCSSVLFHVEGGISIASLENLSHSLSAVAEATNDFFPLLLSEIKEDEAIK